MPAPNTSDGRAPARRICASPQMARISSSKDRDKSVFRLPAGARDVRLVSNTFVPVDVSEVPDGRELGVNLLGLAFVGPVETREISLADPRLADGFHLGRDATARIGAGQPAMSGWIRRFTPT